jgi:hypothetical protein
LKLLSEYRSPGYDQIRLAELFNRARQILCWKTWAAFVDPDPLIIGYSIAYNSFAGAVRPESYHRADLELGRMIFGPLFPIMILIR